MVTNTTEAVMTELVETGEQRDRLGRKITPAARRRALVAAWRESGRTQAAFARSEGVSYTTFASWVQAERRGWSKAEGAPKPAPPRPRFVEAHLPPPVPVAHLEVRLLDGTVLRGSHATDLAALVQALRA